MRMILMRLHALLGAAAAWCPPAQAATADDDLAHALQRIEDGSGGRLGVAVHDLGSGRQSGHRADERFPMCSTFKLLACGAVLARVDARQDQLDRRIRFSAADIVTYSPVTKDHADDGLGMTLAELCAAALTHSDNTAGNLVLASIGGPAAVTAFARSIGDDASRLDRTETALNEATPGDPRDTTTPAAMAGNLRTLLLGVGARPILTATSRTQLTAWMLANQTGGAKLRAGVPPTWRVADKTGGGSWGTTNDIAVLYPPDHAPVIVSVYLTQTSASFDACNATVAAVGRAVAAQLPS